MTEITVDIKSPVSHVGPVAFGIALVAAPLVVGLPCLALLWFVNTMNANLGGLAILAVIPIAAVILGGPSYLLFGGPAMWMALRRGRSVIGSALLANLLSLPVVYLFYLATQDQETAWSMMALYLAFGTLFSLIWSAVFASLYRRFGGAVRHD